MAGRLIVIEGMDGSGKKTQAALLVARLMKEGVSVFTATLPQYGAKSAGPSEEYLSGKYGGAEAISPYAASILYMGDHFDLRFKVQEALALGKTVVLDRYVDSNAGHQGSKITDEAERVKFLEWLYFTEYELLGLPKPNIVVVLHVPASIARQLAQSQMKGGGVKDIHEANVRHLENAEQCYLWLTKRYEADHIMVECVDGERLLPPEKIHEEVYGVLQKKRLI